ncbi:MAG: hypothetical protein ACO3FE_18865, partial [Planctomycetaceae bacterium]
WRLRDGSGANLTIEPNKGLDGPGPPPAQHTHSWRTCHSVGLTYSQPRDHSRALDLARITSETVGVEL